MTSAVPLRALLARNPSLDPALLDDVILGCVNQAGEDNRNVARMALLLAGLPQEVPGTTVSRLCGSSMDAVAMAARAIRSGELSVAIAGGVESMSRAPLVLSKADAPWARSQKLEDTTLGWRFVNPSMRQQYGGARLESGGRRDSSAKRLESERMPYARQGALLWGSLVSCGRLAIGQLPRLHGIAAVANRRAGCQPAPRHGSGSTFMPRTLESLGESWHPPSRPGWRRIWRKRGPVREFP